MRFLKRKPNGHPPLTVVEDVKAPRRPWVVFRGVILREWCKTGEESDA